MARKKWITRAIGPDQARDGIELEAGSSYVLKTRPRELLVELDIDPNDPQVGDDQFTLRAPYDGSKYTKTLTAKDDLVKGNSTITLRYGELPEDDQLEYSLVIDPGADGEPCLLFAGATYAELKAAENQPAPGGA